MLTLLISPAAWAQDMSAFSPQTFATPSIAAEYQAAQVEEERVTIGVPLYKGAESGWALTARGQRVHLGDTLRFPGSGTRIPKEFGSADLGLGWNHEDAAGNKIGASGSYGEAGTRLFGGSNSSVVSVTGFIERKKEGHSWLYFLSYGNNRTLLNNIPVPGVAYAMNSPRLSAIFGLPFIFVNWRPDPYMVTAAVSPFGAMVEPAYRFWGPMQAYAGVNWSPKSYPNIVPHTEDRLLYDKFESGGGVRMNFSRTTSVSLGYLYTFGRRFMIGKSLNDKGNERFAIEDTSGVQLKLKFAL